MSDQQFESYQHHEQDISEEKTEKWRYDEQNMAEEYAEEQQEEEKTEKRPYVKKSINEEQQHEEQPETANEQSRLASYFNFIRQLRSQFGLLPMEKSRGPQPSRVGFPASPEIADAEPSPNEVLHPLHRPEFPRAPRYSAILGENRQNVKNQYKEFVAAASFLSILPFPRNAQSFFDSEEVETQPQLAIGSAYFPLVGLLIALVACLLPVFIGPSLHLPSLVLAALLTVALVCLTGGLHLDGLMDTSDGLFSGGRHERKLEIMRDSHVGVFGVLGGICILLLKFAIFASLDPHHLTLALLIVLPLARWTMVLAIYLFPSARLTGLGVAARQTITLPRLLIAAIISLLIALVAGQLIGFAVWMGGTLVAIIVGTWIAYVLGGLTGDAYGALAETTEVVCLLMLVATW